MATPDMSSSFVRWQLSEQEIAQGVILSPLQKQCIQNQIATFAEEQVMLPFSVDNIQRNAEIIGSIGALRYLITLSEAAEADAMKELIADNTKQQPQEAQFRSPFEGAKFDSAEYDKVPESEYRLDN